MEHVLWGIFVVISFGVYQICRNLTEQTQAIQRSMDILQQTIQEKEIRGEYCGLDDIGAYLRDLPETIEDSVKGALGYDHHNQRALEAGVKGSLAADMKGIESALGNLNLLLAELDSKIE